MQGGKPWYPPAPNYSGGNLLSSVSPPSALPNFISPSGPPGTHNMYYDGGEERPRRPRGGRRRRPNADRRRRSPVGQIAEPPVDFARRSPVGYPAPRGRPSPPRGRRDARGSPGRRDRPPSYSPPRKFGRPVDGSPNGERRASPGRRRPSRGRRPSPGRRHGWLSPPREESNGGRSPRDFGRGKASPPRASPARRAPSPLEFRREEMMRSPGPPRRHRAASPGRLRGAFDAPDAHRPLTFRDDDPRQPPALAGDKSRRLPTFDGENPRRPPTFEDGHSRRAPTYVRGDSRPRPVFDDGIPHRRPVFDDAILHRRSPGYDDGASRRLPASERSNGGPSAIRGARRPESERYGLVVPHRDISPPIPGEFATPGEAPPPPDWRRYAGAGSSDDLPPQAKKPHSKSRSPPRHRRREEAQLVAVIGAANKRFGMSKAQAEAAKAALLAELDKVLLDPKCETAPTFKSLSYESGLLKVHCEDARTLDWLKRTVEALAPPWDGSTRLRLQPPPQRPLKARLWLPGETAPAEVVQRRLAAQNCDWTDIRAWSVLHHEAEPAGTLIVFGVPADDVPKLQKRKFKIHHGFAKLTLACKNCEVKAVVDDSAKR